MSETSDPVDVRKRYGIEGILNLGVYIGPKMCDECETLIELGM